MAPVASPISLVRSPVSCARSQSLAKYTRARRPINSGSWACNQHNCGSVHVGLGRLPPRCKISGFSRSCLACAAARWSLHIIAGRKGVASASHKTAICAPPVNAIARKALSSVGKSVCRWPRPRCRASRQSAGFCSAWPGSGVWVVSAILHPPIYWARASMSESLSALAPRSMPRKKLISAYTVCQGVMFKKTPHKKAGIKKGRPTSGRPVNLVLRQIQIIFACPWTAKVAPRPSYTAGF